MNRYGIGAPLERNYKMAHLPIPPIIPFHMQHLESRQVLLIDIFDTCIKPCGTDNIDTLGTQHMRSGFSQFIQYYAGLGRKIGLHTDSMSSAKVQTLVQKLQLQQYITGCFGDDCRIGLGEEHFPWMTPFKHFRKMMKYFQATNKETVIIGDGFSDQAPAWYFDVDLIEVPNYKEDPAFSFESLMR